MWKKRTCTCFCNKVEFPDDWCGKTDRLLISIFYNTGVRLTELVTLKNDQVDLEAATLRVLGKGNKERIIPISKELVDEIKRYQKEKPASPDGDNKNELRTLLVNDSG